MSIILATPEERKENVNFKANPSKFSKILAQKQKTKAVARMFKALTSIPILQNKKKAQPSYTHHAARKSK
jgi:predicted nucleic acid-binding protein